MQSVKNSYFLYWKIVLKKKISMLIILLSSLYNFYHFYYFIFMEQDPAEALVNSSFIVQGVILASIIFGTYLANLEKRVGMDELILTIEKAPLSKIVGKIAFFISFVCAYLVIHMVSLITMFGLAGIPFSSFYFQSIHYLLLYWGMSSLIGGFIGTFLSIWIEGRMIYVLSLVIWLLISPLNYPFIIQLGILFKLPMTFEIIDFLNLGQNNPHHPYHTFYGYALENYQWFKRLFLLSVLSLISSGSLMIKGRAVKKYLHLLIILIFITTFTFYGVFGKHQVLKFDREDNAILEQDSNYYKDIDFMENNDVNYKIINYDINLEVHNFLKADVVMDLVNQTKKGLYTLDFILYHDLNVLKVTDIEGNSLEFSQDKDVVQVLTGKPVLPNERYQVRFNYEGISSPYFFANHQAINLLNHFPWLPTSSQYNTAMYTIGSEAFRLPLQPNHQISYRLNLSANPNVITNLKQVGPNMWEGKSSDGIYLIAGSLHEETINGKDIIYPYTWVKMIKGFSPFDQFIQNKIKQIDEELQLHRNIDIQRYLFIDHSINSEMAEQHIWIFDNTFIISPKAFLYNDEAGLEININHITYGIVPALTWKYDGIFQRDLTDLQLFDYSYAYFLNIRGSKEEKSKFSKFEYIDHEIGNLKEHYPEKYRISTKVKSFLDNKGISEEKKIQLFREWYKSFKTTDTPFSVEAVIDNL